MQVCQVGVTRPSLQSSETSPGVWFLVPGRGGSLSTKLGTIADVWRSGDRRGQGSKLLLPPG